MNERKTEKFEKRVNRLIQKEIDIREDQKRELKNFFLQYQYTIRESWIEEKKLEEFLKKKEKVHLKKALIELKSYLEIPSKELLKYLVDKQGNQMDFSKITQEFDLEQSYNKVKTSYEWITGNMADGRKRFNLLTLREPMGPITITEGNTEKEYQLGALKRAVTFARENAMQVKLDSICFFRDFPDALVGKKKEAYIRVIENYAKILGKWIKKEEESRIAYANFWKQFIYADSPYDFRKNAWHNRLTIEDFCDIALYFKSQMPNVKFSYSDFGFEVEEKRRNIFEVLNQIQKYEKEHGVKGKLLEAIEFELNFDWEKDTEAFEKAIQEAREKYNLPIGMVVHSKEANSVFEEKNQTENEVIQKVEKWKKDCFYQRMRFQVENRNVEQVIVSNMIDVQLETFEEKEKPTQQEIKQWEELKKKRECYQPKETRQDFNYHTHTRRCRHAEDTSDEEFVKSAIRAGVKVLAFTDHIPFDPNAKHQIRPKIRMDYEEIDEYLHSIEYLKKKYKGIIEIQSGFEFEYSKTDKEYLQKIRSKVDKMVLGQHFIIDEKGKDCRLKLQPTDETLDRYADSIIEAMELRLVDIVVHPDYFLSSRDGFFEKEELITRRLCSAAQKYGIPFEINLGQIGFQRRTEKITYPNREFWKIASEYDIGVIYGKDAHWTDQIEDESVFDLADEIIGKETIQKLKFLQSDLKTPKPKTKKSFKKQLEELDQEVSEKERHRVVKDLLKLEKR